ncbi:19560_t:CDS:2 [Entrophospora sp. SA101]|nr:3829_t:CDS:2 [Entrophospora sp. SA101]CAJ0768970.1 19560_t:CDS:2 [Entrophospora sp. SA101]
MYDSVNKSNSGATGRLYAMGSFIMILPSRNNKNIIKIDLVEPVIIFRGSTQEATGYLLRGVLELNLKKPMKIDKLELEFIGKTKAFFPEMVFMNDSSSIKIGHKCVKERKELISHHWEFINNTSSSPSPSTPSTSLRSYATANSNNNKCKYEKYKKLFRIKNHLPVILNLKNNNINTTKPKSTSTSSLIMAGKHSFPFEIYVPGNLPESIKTPKGSVSYRLVAKLRCKGKLLNVLSKTCKVYIVRILHDHENDRGIGISRDLNELLSYEISIPKKHFIMGQTIPIEVRLTPLTKKIKIHGVKVQLVEKIKYKPKQRKFEEVNVSNTMSINDLGRDSLLQDHDEGDIGNLVYHKLISFQLPKCKGPTNYSCNTPLINVSHELKFTFITTLPSHPYQRTKLRINQKIKLLSCLALDDFVYLPDYEENSIYCPCHPEYQRMAVLILGEEIDSSGIIWYKHKA